MTAENAPGRNVYTREQIAEMWGVNVRTIAREIDRGRLKVFRVGRCIRITQSAIDDYMHQDVKSYE